MAGGHEFAFPAEERGIVDREHHAHRRFIDGDGRKGFGILKVGDGIADLETVDAHHSADVAALDFVHPLLFQAFKDHQVLDLLLFDDVITFA